MSQQWVGAERGGGGGGSLGQSSSCLVIPWGATFASSVGVLLTPPASVPWPPAVCIARGHVFPPRGPLDLRPLSLGGTSLRLAFRPWLVVSRDSLRHSQHNTGSPQGILLLRGTNRRGAAQRGEQKALTSPGPWAGATGKEQGLEPTPTFPVHKAEDPGNASADCLPQ